MRWHIVKAVCLACLAWAPCAGMANDSLDVDLPAWRELFASQRALLERRHREDLLDLADKFRASLGTLEEELRREGSLDRVLALQSFLKAFDPETGETPEAPELAEVPGFVRRVERWHSLRRAWDLRRTRAHLGVLDSYQRMLARKEVELTREDRIEEALRVRAERDRLDGDPEWTRMRERVQAAAEAEEALAPPAGQSVGTPILVANQQALVLYYTFDRNERERTTDVGRQRNHGKTEHTEWVARGRKGGALRFNGRNSIVRAGNPESLQITGGLTLAFWIHPEALGARRNPLNKAYGGEMTLTLEPEGDIHFYHGTSGRNTHPYQGVNSKKRIKPETWTHVCLVRDPEAGEVVWYFNGRETAKEEMAFKEVKPSRAGLVLGRGYAGGFKGMLDEVMIFNRAMSAREVARVYQAAGGR